MYYPPATEANNYNPEPFDFYAQKNYRNSDPYPMQDAVAEHAQELRAAFETFVGTKAEIEAEEKAIPQRIKTRLDELRAPWQAKQAELERIYWENAFAEQGDDIHPKVLGTLHYRAYDRGHSSGHSEVYGYFVEYCNEYRELRKLEQELGLR